MFSLNVNTQDGLNDRQPTLRAHLLALNFSSGQMRICDFHHDVLHESVEWDALPGGILSVSHIIEDSTNIANAWSVTFGEAMITTLLTQQFEGRTMQLYLALMRGGLILGDPIVLAAGEMSSDWIEEPNPADADDHDPGRSRSGPTSSTRSCTRAPTRGRGPGSPATPG